MAKKVSGNNKMKILLLILSMSINGICYSLLFSFFPIVAKVKDLSLSSVGIILSACPATTIVFGFVFGFLLPKMGPRIMFVVSIILQALVLIPFSFVAEIEDSDLFYAASLIFRILQGIFYVGNQVAAFAVASSDFTDKMNMMVGLLETGLCIGLSLGPAIGGILFDMGGFKLPFFVTSGITMFICVLNYFFMHPTYNFKEDEERKPILENSNLAQVNKVTSKVFCNMPSLLLPLCTCLLLYADWTFFDVALANEVFVTYKKSSTVVGILFFVFAASYGVLSPIVGSTVDKKGNLVLILAIGTVLTAPGFMLLGPAPFLNIEPMFWLLIVSMILIAIGGTLMCVPGMGVCHDILVKHNVDVDKQAHAFLASSFVLSANIGSFIGSLLGGALVDLAGFPWSSLMFCFANVLMGICNFAYVAVEICKRRRAIVQTTDA